MNRKHLIFVCVIAALVLATMFLLPTGAENEAKDDGEFSIPADTPVTYGYLEKFKEELRKEIIDELTAGEGVKISGDYEDVTFDKGQIIIPASGTEIIYRGGGAEAVTSSKRALDGITDSSVNKELFSGDALEFGHIYYPSDSDAKKAIVITGEHAHFTIRGEYEVN